MTAPFDTASSQKQSLPFGSWPSDIHIEDVISGATRMGGLTLAGERLWWAESRPSDQGRQALCSRALLAPQSEPSQTVLGAPWNLRNRVHEYGGGALTANHSTVWFCHDADGAIYEYTPSHDAPSSPQKLHGLEGCRYADLTLFPQANVLLAVCEDHRDESRHEPQNYLVAIALLGNHRGTRRVLAEGHDFYSNPCPSPDGRQLAWLSWDHPNMPWDGTALWCAHWNPDGLSQVQLIAGGPDESIFQPICIPMGTP